METAVNAVFEILSFSAIMVLIVVGLGVVASMMGIFNFAHGEFVLLGAYSTYLLHQHGLPVWLAMALAPLIVGLIGLAVERGVIRWFYARPLVAMLGTYALGVVIRETVRGLIGGLYLNVPAPVQGGFVVGGIAFAKWRVAIIVITVVVMLGSLLLLTRTTFGLRVRASLENPSLARVSGISTGTIYALTFTFGVALAGLAGALVVPIFSLFADLGLRFLIQGFLAVMLGGVGTLLGPILGAGAIGSLSAALPWVVTPVLADVLVFAIAIVAMKILPGGFLGGRRALRA
ncbi:MAG: branched-chain amino acid ABC transporter permease [Alphaproteobacteria bacterium]|nr:branched-chain amino acid ABC transporter permease [Alphaproteobacteria bacterium]